MFKICHKKNAYFKLLICEIARLSFYKAMLKRHKNELANDILSFENGNSKKFEAPIFVRGELELAQTATIAE